MRCLCSLLFIAFYIAFSLPLKAQSSVDIAKKYTGYQQRFYKGIRYGFFKPESLADKRDKKLYPLIVYMHGSRDTVSRDLAWYQAGTQQQHPCFVLTPKCEDADQGWGNTWKDGHTPATAKTLALVD